jgi:aspartyl-tRNA(Asn)/glutamyl-tRNA(Gln) amidotransferase subunit B
LPVVNRRAVEWTLKLGLALGCEVAEHAVFARKHYPYPDLPKGYQISQYDLPSCVNGNVLLPTAEGDRMIGIVRAHLEEDAAKTVHVGGRSGRIGGAEHSLIDFNRGGTPLVEIVTAPDIRSADEAKRFLQLLRQTVVELGISDAEMEKGQLRADANVSVRPAGSDELRTRTELKNMNSFNFIARGIEAEIERQIGVWESGSAVEQHTYDFDAATGTLTARRAKEEADDYRYFPEPDLVPVEPPAELVERLRAELPEAPAARIRRIEPALDLDRASVLVTGGLDGLWDATVAAGAEPVAAANVIANNLVGAGVDSALASPVELAKLVAARDRIPRQAFDEAISKLAELGFEAAPYLAQEAVSDASELEPLVDRILEENPGQVAAFRGGKEGLLGFFVGQVMKETQGRADPRVVNELVRAKLTA